MVSYVGSDLVDVLGATALSRERELDPFSHV